MNNTDKETIRIPFSCITGSRVKEGSHLESHVCGLLDDGYPVTVEIPNDERTFASSDEFSEWYKWSDSKNYFAGVRPNPEDDDLDGGFVAAMNDPRT